MKPLPTFLIHLLQPKKLLGVPCSLLIYHFASCSPRAINIQWTFCSDEWQKHGGVENGGGSRGGRGSTVTVEWGGKTGGMGEQTQGMRKCVYELGSGRNAGPKKGRKISLPHFSKLRHKQSLKNSTIFAKSLLSLLKRVFVTICFCVHENVAKPALLIYF